MLRPAISAEAAAATAPASATAAVRVEEEVEPVAGGDEGEADGTSGGEGLDYSGLGESSGEAVV